MLDRSPAPPDWRGAALLTLAGVVPYLNALSAAFAFDDGPVIRDNSVITGAFDLWNILASPTGPASNLYRPLTLLSYALNWQAAPNDAAAFHAVNVALHVAVTWLVYSLGAVLCRNRSVALVGALLFAVHPIHSEAVTGTVGRAELMAAGFGLLALRFTIASMDGHRGFDGLALLSFTAALFSKESAAAIWPLIPLCRAAHRGGSLWPALRHEILSGHWIWFGGAVGLFVFARTTLIGSLTLPTPPIALDNVLAHTPPEVRIRTALAIVADYAGLLLLPLVLSADYSYRQILPLSTWVSLRVACGIALCALGLWAFLRTARHRPVFALFAIFPFVAFALTSNLLFPIGTVKAERLLYFPSVGVALFIALLGRPNAPWWTTRRASVILATILVAFAVRTWIRNYDWADNLTLFRATVAAAPQSAKAHHDLGIFLERAGQEADAQLHYREALRLYDQYDEAAFGIALHYARKGLTNGAIDWYRKTLDIAPSHAEANLKLCGALFVDNEFAAAELACRHGLLFKPADPTLLKILGTSLLEQGDHERAVGVLRRSLVLNPSDDDIRAALRQLEAEGQSPQG